MFKEGYIELNQFIKKHYDVTTKKDVHSKRTTIVKLIKRRNKESLLLDVNSAKIVIESDLYDFLRTEQNEADSRNANNTLIWRLKDLELSPVNKVSK